MNLPPSLPPGCHFYPSDEILLCYYLTSKNAVTNDGPGSCACDFIRDVDLYDYDPFELPDIACFSYGCGGGKRHWYCYTMRGTKDKKGGKRRKVRSGYWRQKGRVRDVIGRDGKLVLGTKTGFVFYLGSSPENAVKTDWILYEYALHDKAPFVLCRVFVKSHPKNTVSEHGLSSCAEESITTVRHIGVQCDMYPTSNFVKAEVHDGISVETKNDISVDLVKVDARQRVKTPLSVAIHQSPSGIQGSQQGMSSVLPDANAMFGEVVRGHHLQSILEEDYIELNDLED